MSPVALGGSAITSLRVGAGAVSAAYLGTVQVFGGAAPAFTYPVILGGRQGVASGVPTSTISGAISGTLGQQDADLLSAIDALI
jgi:hypothetical protein